MTNLRKILLLFAALFVTAPVSARAAMLPDEEPATPAGAYDVTPVPGHEVVVAVMPTPVSGVWIGHVFVDGVLKAGEQMVITSDPDGGYVWSNNQGGAGTLKWKEDHYESEVTQGRNTGLKRIWTPQ